VTAAFADRVIQSVRRLGHPLCVGLDPHLGLIPETFRVGSMHAGAAETVAAVERWCLALLDRVAGRVAVVKPQSAFFEALGPAGLALLARVIAAARERGLLVLLDAKRGDVGSTAEAYAAAYLAADAPFACDALTLNAYLGLDSLDPFLAAAAQSGAGLFVVLRSSNPGARDFQDLPAPKQPLYERMAEALAAPAKSLRGPETEWSGLGAVVGATWPEQSRRVREILPRSLFLVPGYGAQGANARDALAGFVPGPDGRLEGGLVASSRAIGFPPEGRSGGAAAFDRAVDRALDAAIAQLTGP
jgi:orotidine-5'-phosphate decarboxylase